MIRVFEIILPVPNAMELYLYTNKNVFRIVHKIIFLTKISVNPVTHHV